MIVAGRGSVRIESSPGVGPKAPVITTLRDLDMPRAEIDAILGTDDPQLIRRYLALHRERLAERLAEQLAKLGDIEALLAGR